MTNDRDLLPERVVVRARGKGDALTIMPHFVKPVKLLRSVMVELRVPREPEPDLRLRTPLEEERYYDKFYPQRRLRVFADKVTAHFELPRKALRVRGTRGAHLLYIHLWEGAGTKEDYAKMKAVMKYVEKNARTI